LVFLLKNNGIFRNRRNKQKTTSIAGNYAQPPESEFWSFLLKSNGKARNRASQRAKNLLQLEAFMPDFQNRNFGHFYLKIIIVIIPN
jgi:hypothetical protein